MGRALITCLLVGVVIATSGCYGSGTNNGLFVKEASVFARRKGITLTDFTVESVRNSRDKAFVVVSFEGKSRRPGDHFAVYVNKPTKKAERLHLGR